MIFFISKQCWYQPLRTADKLQDLWRARSPSPVLPSSLAKNIPRVDQYM